MPGPARARPAQDVFGADVPRAGQRRTGGEWGGIAVRNASTNSAVVPAKAGTHNHRQLLLHRAGGPAFANTMACGYGSRIALAALACPGRQWRGSYLFLFTGLRFSMKAAMPS